MSYAILKNAHDWFKVHDINTFISKGKLYINSGNFEFELSEEEIAYRAKEYKRLNQNNLIK